jgi:hypothetical protein
MSVLKHLKTLQHVSIIILIIFRELVGSLLKSLNLKRTLHGTQYTHHKLPQHHKSNNDVFLMIKNKKKV